MTRQSAATGRQRRDTGFLRDVQADHQSNGARISGEDDREVVHLLRVPPPLGGGVCTCDACGLVFQSRAATWIINPRQHQDDNYHGKYKSCRPRTL